MCPRVSSPPAGAIADGMSPWAGPSEAGVADGDAIGVPPDPPDPLEPDVDTAGKSPKCGASGRTTDASGRAAMASGPGAGNPGPRFSSARAFSSPAPSRTG